MKKQFKYITSINSHSIPVMCGLLSLIADKETEIQGCWIPFWNIIYLGFGKTSIQI